jgi:hypothetical protein
VRYLGLCARARLHALLQVPPSSQPTTPSPQPTTPSPQATTPSPQPTAPRSLEPPAQVMMYPGAELACFAGRATDGRWDSDAGTWHVVAVSDFETSDARVLELTPAVWNALNGLLGAIAASTLSATLVGDRDNDGIADTAHAAVERLLALGVITRADGGDHRPAHEHGGGAGA